MVKKTMSRPCLIACFGASVFGRRNNLHHPFHRIERPSARRRTSIHECFVLLLRVACPSEDLQYVSRAVKTRLKRSHPQGGVNLLDFAVWRNFETIDYLLLTGRFTARRNYRRSHWDGIIVTDSLVLDHQADRDSARIRCLRGEISKV